MMQLVLAATTWVAPTLIAVVTAVIAAVVVAATVGRRPSRSDRDPGSEPLADRIRRGEVDIEQFERRKLAAR